MLKVYGKVAYVQLEACALWFFLYKTTTERGKKYNTSEDLNPIWDDSKSELAYALSDLGLDEFRRQLIYVAYMASQLLNCEIVGIQVQNL